jgi:CheY-like chemotaxis protein
MIIDGSLTVRMVMKTCLKRAGLEVFDFPDGIQALRWLRNTEEALSFDLIFLDLEVPKMDWYLVMQQLKAHPACNDTILVMLSRHDGLLDRLKARLAGAHSYLAKPFRTQELLTIIQHHFPCIDPQGTTHGKER